MRGLSLIFYLDLKYEFKFALSVAIFQYIAQIKLLEVKTPIFNFFFLGMLAYCKICIMSFSKPYPVRR